MLYREYPEKSFKSFSLLANADGQGVCGVAERSEGKIRRFGM